MLLIPIHLLIDDTKTKFPSFFNEKTLGISRKTIENYLNLKSKPTEKSLNTIRSSLLNTDLFDYDSIENIISLFNNLNLNSNYQPKCFQNLTNKSGCNFQKLLSEIVNLNYSFTMDILSHGGIKIKKDNFISILDKYTNIEPISVVYNSFDHSNYDTYASLTILRLDIILYILSSLDVDLNILTPDNKSKFQSIIPCIENDILAPPYRLLIDKLMKRYEVQSINELAHIICENEIEFSNKKRFINRLRSNIKIYDPDNKSVLDVFNKILKNKSIEFKEIEFEINMYIFTSKILNRLLIWLTKTKILKSDQEIANFFSRYEMWYNHHYSQQQNQPES